MADDIVVPGDDAPHLLVVDDDTRIRTLLKEFLTTNGFRVTVAGTAAEARRSPRRSTPQVPPGGRVTDVTYALRDGKP